MKAQEYQLMRKAKYLGSIWSLFLFKIMENFIDKETKIIYNKKDLEFVAKQAAIQAVNTMLQSSVNLDNPIFLEHIGISEEEDLMPKYKERVEVNGSITWISGNTKQELFEKAAKAIYGKQQKEQSDYPLFAELEEKWMELYKKPNLKVTTYRTYNNLLTKHILPYFENKKINEITVDDIQEFYNINRKLSKSSCHQMKIILSQIFNYAIEENYIQRNPTDSKRLLMSKKKQKREALKISEWKTIISHLDDLTNNEDKILLSLFLFTGMRRGEVLGLRWKNVFLDKKIIYVNENITFGNGNQGLSGTPKSECGQREIPIPDVLCEILKDKGDPEHYVLGKEIHYTESKFDRAWQRIGKQINLFGATPHILRHTYLTILGGTTIDIKTIQTIAGHSDVRVTMEYVHKQDECINNAGIQVSNILLDKKCDSQDNEQTKVI